MQWRLGDGTGTKRYIDALQKRPERMMRIFAVEFYRQASISTPVDTGRARWGWNCSVNSPDLTIPAESSYSFDPMRASEAFLDFNASTDTLYISNAVPYIGALNNGHSRQAPARFVELAFESALNKLKQ